MKKKIGVVYCQESANIGDDVQTVVIVDLIKRIKPEFEPVLVERERLNSEKVEELDALIVSGWFMNHPENWPPRNRNILFISIHISTQYGASGVIQRDKFSEFYKNHEPIGCRDKGTMRRFQEMGVKAYFSGCATLTATKELDNDRRGVLAIDPFLKVNTSEKYQLWRLTQILSSSEMTHCELSSTTRPKMPSESGEKRMEDARQYLSNLASATCVLTSRIHAALPALGLGTPVYFFDLGYDRDPLLRDRFDGLMELFSTVEEGDFKYTSRAKGAKLFRALRLDRLFDGGFKKHILSDEGRVNHDGIAQAKQFRKSIEQTVQVFLDSI